MSRLIALGLLSLLVVTDAQAAARARTAKAPPPPAAAIEVAARTPLYCEGSGHSIQPLVYGDYGDLLAAYAKVHRSPGRMTAAAPTKAGEDGFRLTFVAPPDDSRSPEEVVAFTLTRHESGYALRAVSDKPKGVRAKRVTGSAMCFQVLETLLDADPQRALAFRKAWGERHPDLTGR